MKACTVAGCGKEYRAQGFCAMHYTRALAAGEIQIKYPQKNRPPKSVRRRRRRRCSVPDCVDWVRALRLCNKHYLQLKRGRDTNRQAESAATPSRRHCTEPGCTNSHMARGFCSMHYGRHKVAGTLSGVGAASASVPMRQAQEKSPPAHSIAFEIDEWADIAAVAAVLRMKPDEWATSTVLQKTRDTLAAIRGALERPAARNGHTADSVALQQLLSTET